MNINAEELERTVMEAYKTMHKSVKIFSEIPSEFYYLFAVMSHTIDCFHSKTVRNNNINNNSIKCISLCGYEHNALHTKEYKETDSQSYKKHKHQQTDDPIKKSVWQKWNIGSVNFVTFGQYLIGPKVVLEEKGRIVINV